MSNLIVIDEGHGGADSGAVGSKLLEKDVTLKVGKLIGRKLELKGLKVKYTRGNDKYLTLSDRAKIANAAKADYFISIHCNSFEKPSSNGTETFIYTSVDNNTLDFANHVHQELVHATGLRDRGVKSANFAVLRETSMPAILLELAFISNLEEEKLLSQDEWLDKVSEGIVKGILKHVGKVDDKVFNVTKKAFKIADYKADIIETHDLTGKGIVKRDNPAAMINLALYDMETHTNFMYLENENVRHPNGYKGSKYGIGVKVDGSIIPCTWDEACKSTEIKDFASASPTLLFGGNKCIDWGTLKSTYLENNSHYRMIVGFKGTEVCLCMCNEKMSVEECYQYCASEGFTDAFVYDGNGSQFMYAGGNVIKDSVRENVTWLQLYQKVQNKPQEGFKVDKIKIELNGKVKEVEAINKDGHNYIKLRDLADSKIDVDYKGIPIVRVIG